MCNPLPACIITSGGRNLPSSWDTAQHARPTGGKTAPVRRKAASAVNAVSPSRDSEGGSWSLGMVCQVMMGGGAAWPRRGVGGLGVRSCC